MVLSTKHCEGKMSVGQIAFDAKARSQPPVALSVRTIFTGRAKETSQTFVNIGFKSFPDF
jgi:hypothetical protein